MKYSVGNKETGDILEDCMSLEEAQRVLDEYETQDKKEGIYEENFYAIYENDNGDYMERN